MQNTREINFFARQKELQYRQNQTFQKIAIRLGTLGVLVVVILGGVGFYSLKSMGLKKEISRIDAFLNSPEVLQKFEDVRLKKQTLEIIQQYANAIESAAERIQSYPDFDKAVLKDLENRVSGSLVIQSLNYNNGTINMTCSTNDHNDIANFVYTLRRSPYIHDVAYTGYTKEGEGAVAIPAIGAGPVSKGYTATIEIILKAGGELSEVN